MSSNLRPWLPTTPGRALVVTAMGAMLAINTTVLIELAKGEEAAEPTAAAEPADERVQADEAEVAEIAVAHVSQSESADAELQDEPAASPLTVSASPQVEQQVVQASPEPAAGPDVVQAPAAEDDVPPVTFFGIPIP